VDQLPLNPRPDPPPRAVRSNVGVATSWTRPPLKVLRDFRLLFFGRRESHFVDEIGSLPFQVHRNTNSTLAVRHARARGVDPGVRLPDSRRPGGRGDGASPPDLDHRKRLCRSFMDRNPDGFERLLTEQLTVSSLLGSAA